jgi:hypothetical protein
MLAHIIKAVPPAGVLSRQILFVIIWMFLEENLLHLVRCNILLHYFKVFLLIISVSHCLLIYLFCCVCLFCPVPCPLLFVFVFVFCAFSVIGQLAVDSAH